MNKDLIYSSLLINSLNDNALSLNGNLEIYKDCKIKNKIYGRYFIGDGSNIKNISRWKYNNNNIYYNGKCSIGQNYNNKYHLSIKGTINLDNIYLKNINCNKLFYNFNNIKQNTHIYGNLHIHKNIYVNGTTTTLNTKNIFINNNFINIYNKKYNTKIIINKNIKQELIINDNSIISTNQNIYCNNINCNIIYNINKLYGSGLDLTNINYKYLSNIKNKFKIPNINYLYNSGYDITKCLKYNNNFINLDYNLINLNNKLLINNNINIFNDINFNNSNIKIFDSCYSKKIKCNILNGHYLSLINNNILNVKEVECDNIFIKQYNTIWNYDNKNLYTVKKISINTSKYSDFFLNINGNVNITGTLNIKTLNNKKIDFIPWTKEYTNIYNKYSICINTNKNKEKININGNIKAGYFIGNGSLLTNLPKNHWYSNINNIYTYNNININNNICNINYNNNNLIVNGGITLNMTNNKINGIIRYNNKLHNIECCLNNEWISLTDDGRFNNSSNLWLKSKNNKIYYNNNVGINVINPLKSLEINGSINMNKLYINNKIINLSNINIISGIKCTTTELNILHNLKINSNELNYMENVIPGYTNNNILLSDENNNINIPKLTLNRINVNKIFNTIKIQNIKNNKNIYFNTYFSKKINNLDILNNKKKLNIYNLKTQIINSKKYIGNGFNLTNIVSNYIQKIYILINKNNKILFKSNGYYYNELYLYYNYKYIFEIDENINEYIFLCPYEKYKKYYIINISNNIKYPLFIKINNKIYNIKLLHNNDYIKIINNEILFNNENLKTVKILENKIFINENIFIKNKLLINNLNKCNNLFIKKINISKFDKFDNIFCNSILLNNQNHLKWNYSTSQLYTFNNLLINTNKNNKNYNLYVNGDCNINGILNINNCNLIKNNIWNKKNNNIFINKNINKGLYKININGGIKANIFIGDGSQLLNMPINIWKNNNNNIYTNEKISIGNISNIEQLNIKNGISILNYDNSLFYNGTISFINNDLYIYSNNKLNSLTDTESWNNCNNIWLQNNNNIFINKNVIISKNYININKLLNSKLYINGDISINELYLNNEKLNINLNILNNLKNININKLNNLLINIKVDSYKINNLNNILLYNTKDIYFNKNINCTKLLINGNIILKNKIKLYPDKFINKLKNSFNIFDNINLKSGFIIQNNNILFDNKYCYIKNFNINCNIKCNDIIYSKIYKGNAKYLKNLSKNIWKNGNNKSIFINNNNKLCINNNNKLYINNNNLSVKGLIKCKDLLINNTDINNKIYDKLIIQNKLINTKLDFEVKDIFSLNNTNNFFYIKNKNVFINAPIFIKNKLLLNNKESIYNVEFNSDLYTKYFIGDGNNIINLDWKIYNNKLYCYKNIVIGNNNYHKEKLYINGNFKFNKIYGDSSNLINLPWLFKNNNSIYNFYNIGIGINKPKYELEIKNNCIVNNIISNGIKLYGLRWNYLNNNIYTNNNIGININNSNEYKLNIKGNININGNLNINNINKHIIGYKLNKKYKLVKIDNNLSNISNIDLYDNFLIVSDNSYNNNTGILYCYKKSINNDWLLIKIINGENIHDNFGSSISIYENILIVSSCGYNNWNGCLYIYNNFKLIQKINGKNNFGSNIKIYDNDIFIKSYNTINKISYIYNYKINNLKNNTLIDKYNNLFFGNNICINDNILLINNTNNEVNVYNKHNFTKIKIIKNNDINFGKNIDISYNKFVISSDNNIFIYDNDLNIIKILNIKNNNIKISNNFLLTIYKNKYQLFNNQYQLFDSNIIDCNINNILLTDYIFILNNIIFNGTGEIYKNNINENIFNIKNNNIGIGTNNPNSKLHIDNGNVFLSNCIIKSKIIKKNKFKLNNILEFIHNHKKLPNINYNDIINIPQFQYDLYIKIYELYDNIFNQNIKINNIKNNISNKQNIITDLYKKMEFCNIKLKAIETKYILYK